MKTVAFLGVGGVGGYFGGKMTRLLKNNADHISVYFVARGEHLKAIKEKGLLLKTKEGGEQKCVPTMATDDYSKLPILDICFVCVKQYDLENIMEKIQDKMHENTKIIPLLNGIDIYSRIRRVTSKGIIFPTCVYIGTHIKSPGIIEQNGGACTLILGKDPKNPQSEAKDVCELMERADILYTWSERNMEEIWSKYMFIASYGLVTASENKTLGQIYEDKILSQMVKDIMGEIFAISKVERIELPDDIVETSYQMAKKFPYEAKTSFQRDFEAKNKSDERELFGQTIIDLGIKYNIDTPVTKERYARLNALKMHYKRKTNNNEK